MSDRAKEDNCCGTNPARDAEPFRRSSVSSCCFHCCTWRSGRRRPSCRRSWRRGARRNRSDCSSRSAMWSGSPPTRLPAPSRICCRHHARSSPVPRRRGGPWLRAGSGARLSAAARPQSAARSGAPPTTTLADALALRNAVPDRNALPTSNTAGCAVPGRAPSLSAVLGFRAGGEHVRARGGARWSGAVPGRRARRRLCWFRRRAG